MATAAVVVIGNEILGGKLRDENSPWLATRCRELGLDLVRIVTIPDDLDVIARTVRELSDSCDHVFTSGGVGPTHDDLTMEGIARAFGVPVIQDPDLEAALREKLGERCNEAALRMARVPRGAVLWHEADLFFPQVVMRNVVVFPGVPKLLRHKFDGVAHRFQGTPRVGSRLVTQQDESAIAHTLDEAQRRWPAVAIGSYPQYDQRPWTVLITLDSRDPSALGACHRWLVEHLAPGLVSETAPPA